MGNYTDIELEFNNLVNPRIERILQGAVQTNNQQMIKNQIDGTVRESLAEMRNTKMQEVCKYTGRNLICYISAWVQRNTDNPEVMITDNDMNGLMNAVSGMDNKSIGVDILLHTPGGVVTATESIVNYLRKIFNMDIRVIVPHLAMSAGTMIACSSKEIIMGKQSSLGPIDPQYRNVPAQGVLKEFERAINETSTEPNKALIWREIIQQYRPAFLGECDNIVKMSYDLAKGWLKDCMLKDCPNKNRRVGAILKELASHDASKVHDRHYDYVRCKALGLNVSQLETDQGFQDAVLSLYHTYLLSIYRMPNTLKFIECQTGQTFVITGS